LFKCRLSSATFIFIRLYSIVKKHVHAQLSQRIYTKNFNEALNQLDTEFINLIKICKVRFEPSLKIWLKLIDGIEVEIEYAIILHYVFGCDEKSRPRESKMLEIAMTKIQKIVKNMFNGLKTRFEAMEKL
jgi:hypothetical protein